MNKVVDRVFRTYGKTLDGVRLAQSRERISTYIEILASAGEKDARKLAVYGLAYLKEIHEGRDPRFTGC